MNDADLVHGLRRQDPAAVQHLMQCYLPSVWRFVYVGANGDRHLAEDIVSETVLALLQAVANPETEFSNPSAWLRSVAHHKLQDHFRAAARVQHLIDQAAAASPGVEERDPASHQEVQERRAAVRKVMDDLPEQQRLALEWKYIDKLSVREIAARMATTEKAAESILFRARREFRDGLRGLQNIDASTDADCNGNGCRAALPPASGRSGNEPRSENEAQRLVNLEETAQRRS